MKLPFKKNPFKRERYTGEEVPTYTNPDWHGGERILEETNAAGISVLNHYEAADGNVFIFKRNGLTGALRRCKPEIYTLDDGKKMIYEANVTNLDDGEEHPNQKRAMLETIQPSERQITVKRKRSFFERLKREPDATLYIENPVAIQAERDQLRIKSIKREIVAR